MILAAVGDTGYNIVLLLHILTAMAAFAPVFAHPLLAAQADSLDPAHKRQVLGFLVQNGRRVYLPALVVTGLLGFALAGMSSEVFKMSQGWLIASILVWLGLNGVLHGAIVPAEKAMANGDDSAVGRVSAGGGLVTILMIVMLYLMIFKPGFSG
jgi:uncharacterized membrane protein